MSSQDCFWVPVLLVAVSHRVCSLLLIWPVAEAGQGGDLGPLRLKTAALSDARAPLGGFSTWQVPLLSWAVKASSRKKRGSLISSVGCSAEELNICAAPLMLLSSTRSQLDAFCGSSARRGVMAKKRTCLNWTTANFSHKHARSKVCLQAQSSLIPCFLY